jgi:hypothetical protein
LDELRGKFLPITAAAAEVRTTRQHLSSLARSGAVRLYENPLDRRAKLVDMDEVRVAIRPRPVRLEGDALSGSA